MACLLSNVSFFQGLYSNKAGGTADAAETPADGEEREVSSANAKSIDKPEQEVDHGTQGERNDGWVHLSMFHDKSETPY